VYTFGAFWGQKPLQGRAKTQKKPLQNAEANNMN